MNTHYNNVPKSGGKSSRKLFLSILVSIVPAIVGFIERPIDKQIIIIIVPVPLPPTPTSKDSITAEQHQDPEVSLDSIAKTTIPIDSVKPPLEKVNKIHPNSLDNRFKFLSDSIKKKQELSTINNSISITRTDREKVMGLNSLMDYLLKYNRYDLFETIECYARAYPKLYKFKNDDLTLNADVLQIFKFIKKNRLEVDFSNLKKSIIQRDSLNDNAQLVRTKLQELESNKLQ